MRELRVSLARALAVGFALLWLLGCGPIWKEVQSDGRRFRVLLPETVEAVELQAKSPVGPLLFTGFSGGAPGIGYFRRSPIFVFALSADISGLDSDQRGRLLAEMSLDAFGLHQGASTPEKRSRVAFSELECSGIEERDQRGVTLTRTRVCIADDRIYLLSASSNPEAPYGAAAEKFFRSLALLPRS